MSRVLDTLALDATPDYLIGRSDEPATSGGWTLAVLEADVRAAVGVWRRV